jgi:hypothetical protein
MVRPCTTRTGAGTAESRAWLVDLTTAGCVFADGWNKFDLVAVRAAVWDQAVVDEVAAGDVGNV